MKRLKFQFVVFPAAIVADPFFQTVWTDLACLSFAKDVHQVGSRFQCRDGGKVGCSGVPSKTKQAFEIVFVVSLNAKCRKSATDEM
jgi:hypothetical protein